MCGISGYYNFSGVHVDDGAAVVKRMNDTLRHRGPDDSGCWSDEANGVYLGHRRLSILDLSAAGHQPMISPERSVIVFNGEIYNFRELRERMPDRTFISESDTEVLLHLFDRDGPAFLDDLNGMFGLAVWDPDTRKLLLARDRIGIKPLYYTTKNGIFAFSSEIKALLTLPWVRAELDHEALYHFLTFNKTLAPATLFRGIYKLPPAHRMVVGPDGVARKEAYWEASCYSFNGNGESGIEDRLLSKLRRSVGRRMISDVPVGAFLSGGVDSSAIVALMNEQTQQPVTTYSIGFKDAPGYDELEHARSVSRRFGTTHHERVVTRDEIREFVPRIVEIYDEPLADPTSIPIYFLSELARQNGTVVVLTGDGADELFSGYTNWLRYVRLYPAYRMLTKLPRPLKSALADVVGLGGKYAPRYDIMQRAVDGQEFFCGGAKSYKEAFKSEILSDTFMREMNGRSSYDELRPYRDRLPGVYDHVRKPEYVDWMCFLGMASIIPDFYLYRADRLGMAHSIELRVPFLDHHFVNLALSIPGAMKVANGEPKAILKRTLERVLPPDILYRKKQGFCVPLKEWADDLMVNYLDEHTSRFCSETGLFEEAPIRRQVAALQSGDAHQVAPLWNLYFLMSWFKKWLM